MIKTQVYQHDIIISNAPYCCVIVLGTATATPFLALLGPPEVVAQLRKMGVGEDLDTDDHVSTAQEWCLSPTNPVTLAPVRENEFLAL